VFKRFDESEIWDLHNDYFLNRGLKAWSKGEVPYTGISNYFEAYKKAIFFYECLGNLNQKIEEIKILELGSGNAEFAYNFLKAFEDIDQKNYFSKLKYTVSDYSQKTLNELQTSKKLDAYKDKVIYLKLDINFQMNEIQDLEYDLIMCNYLLDQLPARIIAKDSLKNEYLEKYISIDIGSSEKIKKIRKQQKFLALDFQKEIKLDHQIILDSCFRPNRTSTIIYSYGALRAVRRILFKLKTSGIFIASDFNASSKPGLDYFDPCFYGNSLAQAVNFEFICKYFFNEDQETINHKNLTKKEHQFILMYEDPIKPLHTLILTRPDYPKELKLNQAYEKIYKQNVYLRILFRYLVEIKFAIVIFLIIFLLVYFLYFFK
jgi:hypothetical protein